MEFAKTNILGVVVNDYKAPTVRKTYGGKKYYYYNAYEYSYANPTDDKEEA